MRIAVAAFAGLSMLSGCANTGSGPDLSKQAYDACIADARTMPGYTVVQQKLEGLSDVETQQVQEYRARSAACAASLRAATQAMPRSAYTSGGGISPEAAAVLLGTMSRWQPPGPVQYNPYAVAPPSHTTNCTVIGNQITCW